MEISAAQPRYIVATSTPSKRVICWAPSLIKRLLGQVKGISISCGTGLYPLCFGVICGSRAFLIDTHDNSHYIRHSTWYGRVDIHALAARWSEGWWHSVAFDRLS
ncbi:uncharacterized protein MYCFIDRAFT_204718 [Pseudocercospora fijiensis CIRAD86]|uniref:Uncharacterized protein n=1 Tax=Pseudocercospora fijiensis (strain CIRAD86) TaxID=383855 RepID=M3APY4_PSEFD|nr:uncharacterized protein MYCFIDRAFT_204718 [Pseudocercospora fijiensis CIRAD86]EME79168.1 hypothetical protein MYCFIDRAFT_204718 [Pseudocercospora fijiensis CIRAD86]